MVDKSVSRVRYGEAFWRAHHEAWRRSELNQREYCAGSGDSAQSIRQLAGEVQKPSRNRRGASCCTGAAA
jgi:hypothetical protein